MKIKSILQLCLAGCVISLLAGCASTKIVNREQLVTGPIPRPATIWVYNFAATADEVPANSALAGEADLDTTPQTAEEIAEGMKLGNEMATELVTQINAMGMPAQMASLATKPQINDIVIRGYLLSVKEGSGAMRVIVGFGAGASSLSTMVEGFQVTAKGERKLGYGTVDAGGNKSPGMVLGVATFLATKNPAGLIINGGMQVYGVASGNGEVSGGPRRPQMKLPVCSRNGSKSRAGSIKRKALGQATRKRLKNHSKIISQQQCNPISRESVKSLLLVLIVGTMTLLAQGDVLVGTNGERFVGTVIEETGSNVVFDSELGGRLTFPQSKIRDLQRTPPGSMTNVATASVVATNAPANPVSWTPPGVGHDGSDWVQLKSGEWLKGDLKYIQNKEVEFDSDELDQQTLKLKDVSRVYTAHRVFTQFENRQPAYGTVVISNELVMVNGPEPLALHRDLLMGITPSGVRAGIRNWSGNAVMALSIQSGNKSQTMVSTSAELARRTPNTTLLFDYLGNYSQVDNVQSANNERVNVTYDIRINHDWFVRPVQLEYYQDTLANISYRLTGGVGAGYYIFDRDGLEWTVSAGPSYQYTRFENVEPGQSDTATTPAAVLNSNFKADITQRLTFIQSWQSIFTDKDAGQYSHHSVSTLEFEIKRHLNLDVSFIWDYLQNPQTRSDGEVPQNSDYYLTVGFGVRF